MPNLGRLRAALLTTVVLALGFVFAAPASAAVQIDPSIQGWGAIATADGDPPYACGPPDPSGDPSVDCPATTFDAAVSSVTLVPTAGDDPSGQRWSFDGWLGCPTVPTADGSCVVDSTAPEDPPATPTAVFVDPPPVVGTVTMVRTPVASGRDTVQFTFTADEPSASFECQLDDRLRAACESGIAFTNPAYGQHAFKVWAIDGATGEESAPVETLFAIVAPQAPVQPPFVPPPPAEPLPTLLFPRILGPSKVTANVSRKRTFSLGAVRLKCPAVALPCRASAVLKGRLRKRSKPVVLARKSFELAPSSRVAVKLRVTRKAAKILKQRRLKATAALTIRAPNVTTRKDVSVVLRARRPPAPERRDR